MKALLDLLITERDCIRNIVIADAEIRNLSETETATQEQLKLYWTNRQSEATHELHSVQAQINQALLNYTQPKQSITTNSLCTKCKYCSIEGKCTLEFNCINGSEFIAKEK